MTKPYRILALDGALGALSLAYDNGSTQIFREASGNDALERGIALLDSLLAIAGIRLEDLDGLACTKGPGAFTGLRITLAMAKGLAFAASLPLIAISSYDVIREMLHTPPNNEPLLIALCPRAGVLSLRLEDANREMIATASGPAVEAYAAIAPLLRDVTHVAAWPVTAYSELKQLGLTLGALPIQDEVPALALARLARARLPQTSHRPEAIHTIVADYGEQPATTLAP